MTWYMHMHRAPCSARSLVFMLVVVETLLGGGGGGGECEQTQASNGIQAVMTKKITFESGLNRYSPPSHVFAYLLCFASNSGNNRMSVTNKE